MRRRSNLRSMRRASICRRYTVNRAKATKSSTKGRRMGSFSLSSILVIIQKGIASTVYRQGEKEGGGRLAAPASRFDMPRIVSAGPGIRPPRS